MALDLGHLGSGFASPVLASQRVFRDALRALSHPGTVVRLESDAALPEGVHPAAFALALSLLDADTRLWASPGVAGAGNSLRFHTGCALARSHEEADFALLASPLELPPLASFSQGSDQYPDRSATLILQVASLARASGADRGWRLSGPGIRESGGSGESGDSGATVRLCAEGLGEDFLAQWAHNGRAFPRGVDLFLASGSLLAALPRTTRVEA